jgi:chemotaxis methyl-accepting protein methylase
MRDPEENGEPTDEHVEAVLRFLADTQGIDLRDYRTPTIQRRMGLRFAATGSPNAAAYVERLKSDLSEPALLLSTLLIPVTEFFREPAVFDALRRRVLPELFASARGRPVRAWTAGVATGQEAYSLGMLLALECEQHPGAQFELVATDLDARIVEKARHGRYGAGDLAAVPEALRARFFRCEEGGMCVTGELRDRIRFAQHDLVGTRLAPAEAIIASFDLVMIRNVLIYLHRRLQTKVLDRIRAVLEPDGALILGLTEVLPVGCPFTPYPAIDTKLRIFRPEVTRS